MENRQKLKAISRIYKDLKEIETSPIQGLSICLPDENDPFSLQGNIMILSGIYEGIMLHFEMKIPDTYPLKSPQMTISAGQNLNKNFYFHHHIFDKEQGGYTICIDLLDHGFFKEGEKTGWTPAYTLSTVLVQMQVFFANDHERKEAPYPKLLDDLKKELKSFKCIIKTTDGSYKTHTFDNPYPPFKMTREEDKDTKKDKEIEENERKEREMLQKKKKAYERLTCFLTKITPEDNESPLGYPLLLGRDQNGKMDVLPIMEVLSYEGFVQQIQNMPLKLENFDNAKLRTANGESYNYWFPFYGNETLYAKYRQIYLNSICVLKHGIVGKQEYDFDPELILKIFPTIMNKMIFALTTGTLYRSVAAMEGYCNLLRLFLRFLEDFPQLREKLNEKVNKALLNDTERNKSNLGDMGEFLILLCLSDLDMNNKDMWCTLMRETTARKFLWIMKEMKAGEEIFSKDEQKIFEKNPLMFFENFQEKNLDKFYKARKVANDLFLFNFAAARKFLCDKKEFIKKIDENFGVIDETEIKEFMAEVHYIQNNISNYEKLFAFLGLQHVYSDSSKILELFRESHKLSYIQNYNSLFFPDLNKEFLLKIENVLLLLQWFLINEKNIKFFRFLMHEKHLVFKLKDYSKKKEKSIFEGCRNLPEDFFEILDENRFYLRNLLSQHFLFYYMTFLEGYKFYPLNNYSVLNKMNCLPDFLGDEELCKKKLNFEGIIKSLSWVLVYSFHEILDAFSNENIEKTLIIQKFCFCYKIILKNYSHWAFHLNKLIPWDNKNMANFFAKDNVDLVKDENVYLLILVIILHLRWDGTEKNEIIDFRELLKFIESHFKNIAAAESRFSIPNSDETVNKMVMLLILMKQLDQMEIERVMDQNFFIFEKKMCWKVIEFFGDSWKNIRKIAKTYMK